jgi:hypothetical protein
VNIRLIIHSIIIIIINAVDAVVISLIIGVTFLTKNIAVCVSAHCHLTLQPYRARIKISKNAVH